MRLQRRGIPSYYIVYSNGWEFSIPMIPLLKSFVQNLIKCYSVESKYCPMEQYFIISKYTGMWTNNPLMKTADIWNKVRVIWSNSIYLPCMNFLFCTINTKVVCANLYDEFRCNYLKLFCETTMCVIPVLLHRIV